ncbi:hypothetical protein LXL04_027143 [Taraxacum kok-saghyz]
MAISFWSEKWFISSYPSSHMLALIINVVDLTVAQFPATPIFRCRDTGNYTKKSALDNNLMAALKKVGDMKKENGNFYSASSGKGSDTVNAVAL